MKRPVSRALRVAAALHAALGAAFGGAAVVSLRHLSRTGELPMTPFGFRAFSGGPFDRLSRPAFKLLGWLLVIVSVLDVVVGGSLWNGRAGGARLARLTDPIAFGLAVGFALPFLLIGVPIRAALRLAGR